VCVCLFFLKFRLCFLEENDRRQRRGLESRSCQQTLVQNVSVQSAPTPTPTPSANFSLNWTRALEVRKLALVYGPDLDGDFLHFHSVYYAGMPFLMMIRAYRNHPNAINGLSLQVSSKCFLVLKDVCCYFKQS
jgi:hypothetical protein